MAGSDLSRRENRASVVWVWVATILLVGSAALSVAGLLHGEWGRTRHTFRYGEASGSGMVSAPQNLTAWWGLLGVVLTPSGVVRQPSSQRAPFASFSYDECASHDVPSPCDDVRVAGLATLLLLAWGALGAVMGVGAAYYLARAAAGHSVAGHTPHTMTTGRHVWLVVALFAGIACALAVAAVLVWLRLGEDAIQDVIPDLLAHPDTGSDVLRPTGDQRHTAPDPGVGLLLAAIAAAAAFVAIPATFFARPALTSSHAPHAPLDPLTPNPPLDTYTSQLSSARDQTQRDTNHSSGPNLASSFYEMDHIRRLDPTSNVSMRQHQKIISASGIFVV
eukprot:TRINITY_DN6847_c0_g1_i2.p1 TRINITY_DN6847_c0_g1~~TRINITY_DN6847_c0_g1_i2.p1  ORF type:complete len:347 (-),score=32.54 TRINITY_DN6847_c0_g1_i2:1270-2271(-)